MIKLKNLLVETRYVWYTLLERDKGKVRKILDKLRLKMGKHYDFGAGRKGPTFILELDKKYQNKVLELFVKNRINVRGA